MSVGLIALLDDLAAIAKVAAAPLTRSPARPRKQEPRQRASSSTMPRLRRVT